MILSIGVCITLLAGTVAADNYVGGLPLTTVQAGTVTGDLYISGNPPSSSFTNAVDRTFTLPAAAVAESGRVKWARLYVSSYCGHMQDPKYITYTTKVDWNNDGTWDTNWTETDPGHAYGYMQGGAYGPGNDNSAFAGHGTGEPYLMLNDHTTRVTSDYLSWYNVTNLIQGNQATIKVKVDSTGSEDGRIKVVELVVAYDDPSSTTQTTYWVNQGHDACSYYTESSNEVAVGTTTFNTTEGLSGITSITSAKLIADYMASTNGCYGFPTASNDFNAPAKTGSFTNIGLDRVPDAQGEYSGIDSWDVTSSVSSNSDATFAYSRYLPGSGNAAFYKIPLAFLVVKKSISTSSPIANFTADVTSGTVPLNVQFNDSSTGSPTSWLWDFGDGTNATSQNPLHTYRTIGNYTVNLTVANGEGSDSEVKTEYIVVSEPLPAAPVANFTAIPTSGAAPLTVNFTDQSTGSPTSWLWDFGDDTNSTSQNPSHIYNAVGNYTVNLTVANTGGIDSEVKTGYLIVSEPLPEAPVANFTATLTSGSAPLTVTFTDQSTNSPTSWAWDFNNDGTVDSNLQNSTYTFTTPGTYTVNLTVFNAYGSDYEVKTGYITVVGSGLADTAWPKSGRDLNNIGRSPYNGSQTNTNIWTYSTGGSTITVGPSVGSDGTIYIGSSGSNYNKLCALNPSGTLKWRYPTSRMDRFGSPAIATDGTIYIGSYDKKLYAVNSDGTLKWSYITGGIYLAHHQSQQMEPYTSEARTKIIIVRIKSRWNTQMDM